MRTLSVRLIALVVFAWLAPASAGAQDKGQPQWGEPNDSSGRFKVLHKYNYEAVRDEETGLVWEQSPDAIVRNWLAAQIFCNQRTVGNRKGWRLPTIQELASLIDPTVPEPGPTLPAGHPFSNVQSSTYWSASTSATDTSFAWDVIVRNGGVFTNPKSVPLFVWCVRDGQGVDPQ